MPITKILLLMEDGTLIMDIFPLGYQHRHKVNVSHYVKIMPLVNYINVGQAVQLVV